MLCAAGNARAESWLSPGAKNVIVSNVLMVRTRCSLGPNEAYAVSSVMKPIDDAFRGWLPGMVADEFVGWKGALVRVVAQAPASATQTNPGDIDNIGRYDEE